MTITELDNQFNIRSINVDTFDFPAPVVRSWSNLFGDGSESTITVESETNDGHRIVLWSEGTERRYRSQTMAEAQAEVDEWMEDNRANWLSVLANAASYVHEYNVKRAAEYIAARDESSQMIAAVSAWRDLHDLSGAES